MSDKVLSIIYGVFGAVLCVGALFINESMPIWFTLLQASIGILSGWLSCEIWDRVNENENERR